MMKIFLLLGGNILNFGIYKKFKDLGYEVFVVDWNENPQIHADRHYKIDVKDANAIIKALKNDKVFKNVDFAYSSIDLAVPSVAAINSAIGLSVLPKDSLKFAVSKSMMTQEWAKNGLLNRISKKYSDFSNEILDFNKERKIIIKPDNSASSRGITIVDESSDIKIIKSAFKKAKDEATNKSVVVEEFIEGVEFTAEMIGDKYGNVCVYAISQKEHTKHTKANKIAIKLHYNAIANDMQEKIANFAIKCYKALGFSTSLGHLELIVKNDGTMSPVEIGARSSGYIISDLVDIVSGRNFLLDLLETQKGQKLKNGLHPQTNLSSMYYFYDIAPNTPIIKACNLLDFTSGVKSRAFKRDKLVVGNKFDFIDSDNARIGFEILEAPKEILTQSYIAQVEQEFLNTLLGRNNVL